MEIEELIIAITQKNQKKEGVDVYPPASEAKISAFEEQIGFLLPADFREFYLCCDGFGCVDDIFNMIPLSQIRNYPKDYGVNWFYFAEYMIYSDMWGLRINQKGEYEIFNEGYPNHVLTSSLKDFLEIFLEGNVFEPGGLYEWQGERIKLGMNK